MSEPVDAEEADPRVKPEEDKEQKDKRARRQGSLALLIGVGFLVFGFLLILGFALNTDTFAKWAQIVAMFTVLGGGSLVAGALVGFLFGLPKTGPLGSSEELASPSSPAPVAPAEPAPAPEGAAWKPPSAKLLPTPAPTPGAVQGDA